MPPTPRLGRAPPAFASRRVGCDADRLFSCPFRCAAARPAETPHRGHESADARDAGLAAQAVEGGQDRAQIIPLIEAEIAKREDKRADDGGRDLDDKSHWRVREHGIASPFVDYERWCFVLLRQR